MKMPYLPEFKMLFCSKLSIEGQSSEIQVHW